APDRADSKSNLTAPLASQFDSTASKSIGVLTCAVGKSIPHSAVSKCYLESLDQEGGRVEGKVVGGEESEVGAVDGATAYPGPIPGKAALDAAAEVVGEKGEELDAPPSSIPGKAPYSRCRFRVVTPLGDRVCDMLAPAGSDLCVDHAWRVPR